MTTGIFRANCPFALLCVFLLIITFSISCNGGPAAPELYSSPQGSFMTPTNERNARNSDDIGNHGLWGLYTMIIDQDTLEIEVIDNRELAMHLNVKDILLSDWWCPAKNCIQIQFLNIDPDTNIYTIKGTLINPSHLSGYDVRVIIFYDDTLEHDLLNADDYTMLYEPDTDINPFKAYAKTIDDREFKAYSSFSEIFEMYIPPVPGKFRINFAIDASYPQNCEEPYNVDNFGTDGVIFPDDPDLDGINQGEMTIFTEVYDWQDNVSEVTIDTTPITGGITVLAYNPDTLRYEALIADAMDAPPGDYRCLIAAYSEDDPDLGLFNYLVITVDETPPPAVQTISGILADSFFLDGLDGMVSVVNQDILCESPDPLPVTGGEYLVNVVTGTFNISVTPNDLTHHTQVVWNVEVTTDEDVKLDIGLMDPTQTDPYGPFADIINYGTIMGFGGRVVDEFNNGIPYASIELQSPDSPNTFEVQENVLWGRADENGYYSILNAPIIFDDFNEPITTYRMLVHAEGYQTALIEPIPVMQDQTFYNVVTLIPEPVTAVIWEDSFESTPTDWSINGLWHVQTWNTSIVNISYDPMYNFLVIPADEGPIVGNIPEPVDGANYLWYGVEADGNFLDSWDPGQGSYTGGLSEFEHFGTATSPEIDLTGYTNARVEFDFCYDIESQIPSSFDETRFWIVQGGGDNFVQFYNTFVDPGPSYWSVSMAGWHRTSIWAHFSYDLTPYVGDQINLRYTFGTNDSMYNGGRGSFIDNVKVYAE